MTVWRNSASWPPSFPSRCSIAKLKPSLASAPIAENGPEISLAIPTLIGAAWLPKGNKAAVKINEDNNLITRSPNILLWHYSNRIVATRLQRHFPPCCQRVLARLKKSLVSVPIFLGVLLSAGCTSLPSPESRQASYAPSRAHTKSSSLGQAVGLLAQQHPGLSGIYPLADPKEAFAVRALLADAAEQTLDVQYYIWRNDLTGILLIQHLRQAADRGVRVRLLLDDSANVSFDELLASLDAHENIDVRLFNPLAIRFPRWLNFILDFQRVNRRMHSKSFIADNQAAILGGRNVGDEYFGANAEFLFSDLDAIAVGPVVRDVSQAFDLFWNSDFAYPVSQLLPKADKTAFDALDERAEKIMTSTEAREFVQAMNDSSLITELLEGRMALEWAPTRMLTDQPDKIMDTTDATSGVASQLNDLLQQAKSHIELISSYFVPTKTGSRRLRRRSEERRVGKESSSRVAEG